MTLRALAGWLVGLAAVSCTPFPQPSPASRATAPSHLGTQVATAAPLRPSSAILLASPGAAYVRHQQGPGYDAELNQSHQDEITWYRIDSTTNEVTTMPLEPVAVEQTWSSLLPHHVLVSAGPQVFELDGTTWSTKPPLESAPQFLIQDSTGRLFARTAHGLWLLAAGERVWASLTAAVGAPEGASFALGPFTDERVRLVWLAGERLCTVAVELTSQKQIGEPTCEAMRQGGLIDDAVNGSPDDFQVFLQSADLPAPAGFIARWSGGMWRRGSYVQVRRVLPTPALGAALARSTEGNGLSSIIRFEGGQPVRTEFFPGFSVVGCDRAMGCEQYIVSTLQTVTLRADALWVLRENLLDATRTLYVRRFTLPQDDGVQCPGGCGAGSVCRLVSTDRSGCVLDPAFLSNSPVSIASLKFQVVDADGVGLTPPLRITDRRGETLEIASRTSGNTMLVDAPANSDLTLAVDVAGHVPLRLDLRTPSPGIAADLGVIALIRGQRVGSQVGSGFNSQLLLGDHPNLVVPIITADGGAALAQISDSELADGGLEISQTTLTTANVIVRASPDQRWLLISDGSALHVLEVATHQYRPLTTSGLTGAWYLGEALFSRDGTTVAIERANGISVIALSSQPLERFNLATESGTARPRQLQLSKNGTVLLARTSSAFVVVTAGGAVSLTSNGGGPPDEVVLSGDGSTAYLVRNTGSLQTVSVRATVPDSVEELVSSQASALAVDPDGSSALLALPSVGAQRIARYSPLSATSTDVALLTGTVGSLAKEGALWVSSDERVNLFFPAGAAAPRTLTTSGPFFGDEQGAIQSSTLWVTESKETVMARGPGVFRSDASRRINPTSRSIDWLVGDRVLLSRAFAATTVRISLDPRFTSERPSRSVGSPCALFSTPDRRVSIDERSGEVTWFDDTASLICVK